MDAVPCLDACPAVASRPARAWLAVLSITLGSFVLVTSEFLPVGLLPSIAQGLGVQEGTAGLMVTAPGAVAAISAPLLAVMAGRLDRRTVLVGLSLLLALSNLAGALAQDFATMLMARVILGVAVGGFWATAVTAAARLVPARSTGMAMALVMAGISLGTILGVPAGTLLGGLFGWRLAFWVGSAMGVVALLAQVMVLPSLPIGRALTAGELLHSLASRNVRVGIVATAFLFGGHFAAYTFLAPVLLKMIGVAPAMVTPVLLAYGLAGLGGNFLGGWLVGRWLKGTLVGVGVCIALPLLLLPMMAGLVVPGIALVVLWGAAFGAMPVATQGWMMRNAVGSPEGGQALFVCVLQVFLASGALVGGVVVNGMGLGSAVVLGGVLVALGMATVAAFGRAPAQA